MNPPDGFVAGFGFDVGFEGFDAGRAAGFADLGLVDFLFAMIAPL